MPEELKFKFILAAEQVKEVGCLQARLLPGGEMVYYTRIGKDEPLKDGETIVAQADNYEYINARPYLKNVGKVMRMNKRGFEGAEDTERLIRIIAKPAALARGDYKPHEDPAP